MKKITNKTVKKYQFSFNENSAAAVASKQVIYPEFSLPLVMIQTIQKIFNLLYFYNKKPASANSWF